MCEQIRKYSEDRHIMNSDISQHSEYPSRETKHTHHDGGQISQNSSNTPDTQNKEYCGQTSEETPKSEVVCAETPEGEECPCVPKQEDTHKIKELTKEDICKHVPDFKNFSRQWIMMPSGHKKMETETEIQSTYVPPKSDGRRTKGPRRLLWERFIREKLEAKVMQEEVQPPPIEEYSSEYLTNYNMENFKPHLDCFDIDSDFHRQYPLYSGGGVSFWQQKSSRSGVSTHPFRRNTSFTKPLDEVLDEPIGPAIR